MIAIGLLAVGATASPAAADILVAPASDLVVAASPGYSGTVTITVKRGATTIGTASGPAQDLGLDGFGLEVNHGVAGFARPGDCWDGAVPDIHPGDTVEVTNGTTVETMTVHNLSFTADPVVGDVVPTGVEVRFEGTSQGITAAEAAAGDVTVDVRHRGGDGVPEIRAEFPVTFDDLDVPSTWTATLIAPDQTAAEHIVNHAEIAVAFGHLNARPAVTLQEFGLPPGPIAAAGCDPPVFPPPPPPVLETASTPAPQASPTPLAVVTASPILRRLRIAAAITRAGFLRKGMLLHVRADKGARVVRLSVWRLRARRAPVFLGAVTRALPASGMAYITLGRRIIGSGPGTYLIQAAAGVRLASLGGTKRTTFRINR